MRIDAYDTCDSFYLKAFGSLFVYVSREYIYIKKEAVTTTTRKINLTQERKRNLEERKSTYYIESTIKECRMQSDFTSLKYLLLRVCQ